MSDFVGALQNREIPALYQASELVVFPSVVARDGDQEGFGLVLVEAMGCECAVIATDLPAIRDIIIDGKTGLLVPEKDSARWPKRSPIFLTTRAFCSSLAKDGRDFVLERYDWRNIAAQYEAFFTELMAMGRHQG